MKLKWKIIKWLSGLLSLYMTRRLKRRPRHRAVDVMAIDGIMRLVLERPKARAFGDSDRAAYQQATGRAQYWHGTGRYQYVVGQQDKTKDTLSSVLEQGSTKPFVDVFDAKNGKMTTTSVAKQRAYARIYADMHFYGGADKSTRYGSPRFWAYYFVMAIQLHAIKELNMWNRKIRHQQIAEWRNVGQETWTTKVSQETRYTGAKFFDDGSDIMGNYGVIFGIKKGAYKHQQVADYIARHESRLSEPIPVTAFTHLEVPRSHIKETKKLLLKYGYGDLPVFELEQCERYWADKHFSELV